MSTAVGAPSMHLASRPPFDEKHWMTENEEGFVGTRKSGTDARSGSKRRNAGDRISLALAERIGAHKFDMWFGHARMDVQGDRLDIATDSEFVANWIDKHFAGDLRNVAEDALGESACVNVRVAPDEFGRRDTGETAKPEAPGRRKSKRRPAAKATSDRAPQLRHLTDFVVGESNKLAHTAATRIAEDSDARSISPLFLHGDCGLGKTHLLQGICDRCTEVTGRPRKVRYVTAEQFTNEYIAAIRSNTLDSFRATVRKLDLLAIDDVHFFSNKVRTQSELLHTLDEIDLAGARVVLASDEHPRNIKKFSQALISRFLSGMVVKIDRPDRDTRFQLIRRLAVARGLQLSDAAVEEIATHCVGSIRELEGAVTKLFALKALLNRPVTADGSGGEAGSDEIGVLLAEQLFKDQGWQPTTPVRMSTILDHVCDRLAIGRADLMSSGRHRRVVLARALVAYLGRELTTQSYPEIARELGRSYHSTVHTAAQRLKRQMDENGDVDIGTTERPMPLRELVDQLRHEILKATGKT
jgi:chromosomal replication initiator protein